MNVLSAIIVPCVINDGLVMILKTLLKSNKQQRNGFGLTNNEHPHMGLGGIHPRQKLTSTFR